MLSIKQKIQNIKSKYNKKISELTKKMNKEIANIEKNFHFCRKYNNCLKYFKSKNILKFGNYGCNDYVKNSDYYQIKVEDYRQVKTYTDSGYGDGDMFRFEHIIQIFQVCSKCGRCRLLDEKILDSSEEWCRLNWDEECPKNYIPFEWKPIITIIKGKTK